MRYFTMMVTALLVSTTVLGETRANEAADDVAIYAGQYSSFRRAEYETVLVGLEYRWADVYYGIRPTVGFWANGDDAAYAYGGIYWDIPLGIEPIMITPGVAAGYYNKGDSKDLGSSFEFRDTLEISYRFESGQRLGAQITHMSNAGLGDDNPGVEMLQLVYTHPLW